MSPPPTSQQEHPDADASDIAKADIVVIGAGPAGSATATLLARRGYDVILLDRARFPRDKVCGDYLTPGAVRLLRDDIGVLPALLDGGARPVCEERIVTHRGRVLLGSLSALSCPRIVTDSVVLAAARESGARVFEGFSVRGIVYSAGNVVGVVGRSEHGESVQIQARVTVGADGSRSLLARAMGVVRPTARLQRIALSAYVDASDLDSAAGTVSMHLPVDGTVACCGVGPPAGPDARRNVNIVVPMAESTIVAGRMHDYFLDRLKASFPAVLAELGTGGIDGAVRSTGCFGHSTRRATAAGAILVGDAATFVHPFTGEGVYFSLEGARMAALAIDRALKAGSVVGDRLAPYDEDRRRTLAPRYRLSDAVQMVVHSRSLLRTAAALLSRSPSLRRRLFDALGDI